MITLVANTQISAVFSAQLNLARIDENVHRVSIVFFYDQFHRSINFDLKPAQPAVFSRTAGGVVDVYPLNGISSRKGFKITEFVKHSDRIEIQKHITSLDACADERNYDRCLVIDFKDLARRYENREKIAESERSFAQFFNDSSKKPSAEAKIYRLIRSNRIHFFINEGSLKADLIKRVFNPEESSFLQSKGGSILFCQLCEFLMNGFKKGCGVFVGESIHFRPLDYVTSLQPCVPLEKRVCKSESGDFDVLPALPGKAISIIHEYCGQRLITYYPFQYRDIYSDRSEYYLLIIKIFKARHSYESGTTCITI